MNFDKLSKNLGSFLGASDLVKNFPDSIILTDGDGKITEANKKAVECFHLQENIGQFDLNCILKDGIKSIEDSIHLGKPVLTKAFTDEKEFYVEINASKHKEGFCICIRDVSRYIDDKYLDERIVRFNGEKNAMLAKLGQDFLSPINSIIGFSKGLLEGLGGELNQKQEKYIKIISNNANDICEFIQKLLEFTQAESSLCEQDFCQFDIVMELKNIVKNYEKRINEKKIELKFDYSQIEKRTIYWDLKALKTCITNIFEVSLARTDSGFININIEKPSVDVCMSYNLKENKEYYQLTIRDSGIGFEQSEFKYLCDPYAQLDKNKKDVVRAFKLGAASIFAKRSGAYININSELMTGTTYTIIIPIEKDENE